MHFEASNGDGRKVVAGSAMLLDDTAGIGHVSKVLGSIPAALATVRLPELEPK
jgi:hypothetical protein